MLDRFTDCPHIAVFIIGGNDGLANGVNEFGIPLRIESRAARSYIFNDPGVIPHTFADADFAGKPLLDFHIDPLHQAPAFGYVIGRNVGITVNAFDIDDHVPAQAVGMVLLEPHQSVIAQILAHFAPTIIGARLTPGGLRAAIIVKIDSPFLVFAPTVKLPPTEIGGAKVVVDDIYDNGNTMLM